MTTSALAATPTYARRPVPWHRLLWVAWRRYRTTLGATVALLGLVAVYLLVRGHQMRTAYAAAQACRPQSAVNCRFAFDNFHNTYANVGFLGAMLVWIPAVIGAFAGAPLLARELETGTFRFAWTQGVGRLRWLVAHLVPGALGVAVTSAAFGALITWYDHPLVASGIEPRLHASEFPLTGVAVVGWALAAYALGVLVGLVSRRVVPALAAWLCGRGWPSLPRRCSGLTTGHPSPPGGFSSAEATCRSTNGGLAAACERARPRSTRCCRPSGCRAATVVGTSGSDQEVPPSIPSSTCSTTGTANGPAISPTAGIGPSIGSSSAGWRPCRCSCWRRRCGWYAAGPRELLSKGAATPHTPCKRCVIPRGALPAFCNALICRIESVWRLDEYAGRRKLRRRGGGGSARPLRWLSMRPRAGPGPPSRRTGCAATPLTGWARRWSPTRTPPAHTLACRDHRTTAPPSYL